METNPQKQSDKQQEREKKKKGYFFVRLIITTTAIFVFAFAIAWILNTIGLIPKPLNQVVSLIGAGIAGLYAVVKVVFNKDVQEVLSKWLASWLSSKSEAAKKDRLTDETAPSAIQLPPVNIYNVIETPSVPAITTLALPSHSAESLTAYLSNLVEDLGLWRGLGLKRSINLENCYVSHFIDAYSKQMETISDKELLQKLSSRKLMTQKVLIQGPAGSGKTTLLKNWALGFAQRASQAALNECIPIFVPLGSLAYICSSKSSWDIPLAEFVASMFSDSDDKISNTLIDSLNNSIRSDKAFILLDAADEVPEDAQYPVKIWLDKVCHSVGQCPIVLTSRPCDYVSQLASFTSYYIRSWTQQQRNQFIDKWFQSIDKAQQSAAIQEQLERSPLNVPEIAGIPLFLTMMCIEFEVTSQLSSTAGKLLDVFTRILLDLWDSERLVERRKLPLDLKLRVLESVASHFFECGYARFDERELINHVTMCLCRLSSSVQADEIIKEIESGSGLLVRNRAGYCQFSHPLFQEFFVAREKSEGGEEEREWIQNHAFQKGSENIVKFYKELKYDRT